MLSDNQIRVLLVDDHKIIRDGLKQIISVYFPTSAIDDCSHPDEVLPKLKQNAYTMVITDLSMPGRNGLDLLKEITESYPALPVLVLSMLPEDPYAIQALKSGAWGFISKSTGGDEVIKAMKYVLQGRKYLSQVVTNLMAHNLLDSANKMHSGLSEREFEIFILIAEGYSISEISEKLFLSQSTVSTYRSRILQKMQLNSNSDIIKYAISHNLITPL